MIIKVCRNDGYDYFEADSVNVDAVAWGDRKVLNPETRFILKPDIIKSESVYKTTVTGKIKRTYIESGNDLPYMLKLLFFKKGEKHFTLVTDVLTFLMNDEGKTIDRIN